MTATLAESEQGCSRDHLVLGHAAVAQRVKDYRYVD
jgi:hypothetical protein